MVAWSLGGDVRVHGGVDWIGGGLIHWLLRDGKSREGQSEWGTALTPSHIASWCLLPPPSASLPPKVVFFDNGRLVWEAGSNRRIDVSGLSSTTDGHFTLYWGAPGVTPLIAIPRVEPELVEGEVVDVGPEGERGEREEAVRQTVVLQKEDNEEQQVWVLG